MFEGCDGRVCDFVCCLSCRGQLIVIKGAEIGGGGCFDDLGEARIQDLFREKEFQDWIIASMRARFGCDESLQVCRCSDVSRSFEPNCGLASTEGRQCRAVL